MTNDEMVRFIINHFEGGYVDHPDDPGGATNWGVTQRTLAAWRGQPVTAAEVQALPLEEAVKILSLRYLEQTRITDIGDWRLRLTVLDFAIHSGPATAIMALQKALGLPLDGVLTPDGPTLRVANIHPDTRVISNSVIATRLALLGKLLEKKPMFARGWLSRIGKVLTA